MTIALKPDAIYLCQKVQEVVICVPGLTRINKVDPGSTIVQPENKKQPVTL